MPTVIKTWDFPTDSEGLADEGLTSDITFVWDASDAAVEFTDSRKAATRTEGASNPSTGETWETWGVPVGGTVTSLTITSWQDSRIDNTKLTSHTITATVIDSADASVTSVAGNLINAVALTTTIGGYDTHGPETARVVDGGSQASTTDVRLRLEYTAVTSGGAGSASVIERFDAISLEITYTDPGAADTRRFLIT
tara:strand:- start:2232 stop:2819 length:588 start_codon:yes stop_codon:yes gene_type:complete